MNSSSITKRSSRSLNPRDARRRKLKKNNQLEHLRNLWRIIFFVTFSLVLGFIFVINSQTEISIRSIHVKGADKLNSKSIINASDLYFPRKLLRINPRELESILLKELPLKAIEVRRRIIPPGIEIELTERQPIAFASKQISINRKEEGMVDETGYWMPLRIAKQAKKPKRPIYIQGWMPGYEKWISKILINRNNLGSSLRSIILKSNGEISLETKDFKRVLLGSKLENLEIQIKILANLDKLLPYKYSKEKNTIFDIKDPNKPELQLKSD